MANATLTPGATTGSGIIFTASAAVFLEADVGRYIIAGAARALIKNFGASAGDTSSPNAHVRADILDDFPSTSAIAAGTWFLRLSPQAALTVNHKTPVGQAVTLVLDKNGFRSTGVGKLMKVYGGLIKIDAVTDAEHATGVILSELHTATTDPPSAAPAGSWSLEVPSWSNDRGWPQAVEFHQGRLWFGGTKAQPTTLWGSASNSFENFATGSLADNAVEYTIANRTVNIIQWLKSLILLFIGDAENEHDAKGTGVDAPIGGDSLPYVVAEGDQGAVHALPIALQRAVLFLQNYGRKIIELVYDIGSYGYVENDLNLYSPHLAETEAIRFRQHPLMYAKEPNSLVFVPRFDGQICAMTYHRTEQVAGWARTKTRGMFENVCVLPDPIHRHDDIIVVASRTVNNAIKRYIEIFVQPTDLSTAVAAANREWLQYETDCAVDGTLAGGEHIITGLDHQEGRHVDVILGSSFIGSFLVTGGQIDIGTSNIADADRVYEAGSHYNSTLQTMRPSITNQVVEGLRRFWKTITLRVLKSVGGTVNGEAINYSAAALDTQVLRTGTINVNTNGQQSLDGYITIEQKQPYPMQILSVSGEVIFGDISA